MRIAALIVCLLPFLAVAQPVVPGFDRFQLLARAEDPIASGEVLITELNCIGCHVADKQQSHRFEARPAPVLFTTHNISGKTNETEKSKRQKIITQSLNGCRDK